MQSFISLQMRAEFLRRKNVHLSCLQLRFSDRLSSLFRARQLSSSFLRSWKKEPNKAKSMNLWWTGRLRSQSSVIVRANSILFNLTTLRWWRQTMLIRRILQVTLRLNDERVKKKRIPLRSNLQLRQLHSAKCGEWLTKKNKSRLSKKWRRIVPRSLRQSPVSNRKNHLNNQRQHGTLTHVIIRLI